MTEPTIAEAFAEGQKFSEYLSTMETLQRHMREQYEMLSAPVDAFDPVALMAAKAGITRLLLLTEDYCPDSVMNLSIAARMANVVRSVQLRIVHRDDFRNIADQFPAADGYNHIPTLLFLREDDSVSGVWHERPAAAHARIKQF